MFCLHERKELKKIVSHLDKLVDRAYYYGLKPSEVANLTVAEMARFIDAREKKEFDDLKKMAKVGYTVGILASMSLSTKRPSFEEAFGFRDEASKEQSIERSKNEMLAWAINMNSQYKEESK